jgi:hypothetical protein
MVFAETPLFTELVTSLWSDDELSAFQRFLIQHPDAGNVIEGSGGVRKVRWKMPGRGKRGGARVVYFWAQRRDQILLLLIYTKSKQDDLTEDQKGVVRSICADWNKEEDSK